MDEALKNWSPLTVHQIAEAFAGAGFPWWIAGGFAIELAVGKRLRAHGDIDVLILRDAEGAAFDFLAGWDCWAVTSPGVLQPWSEAQTLSRPIHDVWCRKNADDDWRFQVMVDEQVGNRWQSRRNAQISMPLSDLTRHSTDKIPYLTPEAQLFYKAKTQRPKDEIDFEAAVETLSCVQRQWLSKAITMCYGEDHSWLARI
jgi:hypothetical protein